ncbi:MAG TPA: FAD-dependent oxidoreductase [Burkholderiales bacterium]|nr:FAD-dependent oxidoreductase [Burkholderiales bacterium]
MKVVVMGAGLAGVTTAWYLAKEGHEVAVLDREPEVAAAASYANTGIIAASRAYPWTAGEIGRTLRRSALRADFELSLWGLQHLFLRTAGSYRRVLEAKARLVRYSQQELHALVAEIGFKGFRNGVLYLYRDAEALDEAWERSAVMRERGFTVERLERAQLPQHEPALDVSRLAGALYAPVDEFADSAAFCRELAARCRSLGVSFYLENEIQSIEPLDTSIREVVTRKGRVRGDAYVCALGVMDRRLREQLGIHVPVYPVTGYSATLPLLKPAPRLALIDEARGVALAPQGEQLRVTGGAEFAGYDVSHEPQDFAPLYDSVKQLLPGAVDYSRARVRACQRPMTPETTPRFGTGRYQNLWFNIGLGHMGFAMAAGAGRVTAEMVCGRTPPIDLEGLRIRRH